MHQTIRSSSFCDEQTSNTTTFESVLLEEEFNTSDLIAQELIGDLEDDFLAVVSWGHTSEQSSTILDVTTLSQGQTTATLSSGHSLNPKQQDHSEPLHQNQDDLSTISSIDADTTTAMDESHTHFARNLKAPWELVLEVGVNAMALYTNHRANLIMYAISVP